MPRLAVFNQKGGVAKTTTSLNLAAGLNRIGRQVVLLDLDPQAHLSSIRGDAPESYAESSFAFYKDERTLGELEQTWFGRISLIPAHAELIKVDTLFGKGPGILNKLRQGLETFEHAKHAHTTIIDCSPYIGVLSLNAIFAATCVLVPVTPDHLSLRGALQTERTFRTLEPVLKRSVRRRYVMTRFDRRRKLSYEIQRQLGEEVGAALCRTVISENVAIAESPATHKDVLSHAPASRGAYDYLALLEELLETRDL